VCAELGLESVRVVRGRAETADGRFDVVTARALAALPKLLGWGLPLVAEGGQLLAMKGSSAAAEIADATAELDRWAAVATVVTSSVPGSSITTVVRVVRDGHSGIGLHSSNARRRGRDRA
jgi:16S rRNA (guanine527-N7)-methyltransferase